MLTVVLPPPDRSPADPITLRSPDPLGETRAGTTAGACREAEAAHGSGSAAGGSPVPRNLWSMERLPEVAIRFHVGLLRVHVKDPLVSFVTPS